MQLISVQQAGGHLVEVIENWDSGEEVALTQDNKPLATNRVPLTPTETAPRKFGTLKGPILSIAPDFDAIPEGFEDDVDGEPASHLP